MAVEIAVFGIEDRCSHSWHDILEGFVLIKEISREIKITGIIKSTPFVRPPEMVIVNRENRIISVAREYLLSGFAAFPLKESPFISISEEISPHFTRTEGRGRDAIFLVENEILICHDEFLTSDAALLFFDDVFVERYEHDDLFYFSHIFRITGSARVERKYPQVGTRAWRYQSSIPRNLI